MIQSDAEAKRELSISQDTEKNFCIDFQTQWKDEVTPYRTVLKLTEIGLTMLNNATSEALLRMDQHPVEILK